MRRMRVTMTPLFVSTRCPITSRTDHPSSTGASSVSSGTAATRLRKTSNTAHPVLLIGERPGLATAESLGAYMAYRPRPGHSDAQRNLISNIHRRGVAPADAARRILALADKMCRLQAGGVNVKEE